MDKLIESGTNLLNAIEHLLADDATITGHARLHADRANHDRPAAAHRIVAAYSNRSALAGAIAAAPAIVPGWGTAGAIGTLFAEMSYVLKTEVEMCLCLSSLHGFEISSKEHRQIAFLLAAIATHEVETGRNVLLDIGEVTAEAAMTYTPREAGKSLLKILGILAAVRASQAVGRGVLHVVPFVGMAVGAGVNKALTRRVGLAAHRALALRSR